MCLAKTGTFYVACSSPQPACAICGQTVPDERQIQWIKWPVADVLAAVV